MGSDYYKVINHLQKVGFSNHSHCKRKETDEIVFDQRKCKRIGLSASTIMDIIFWQLKTIEQEIIVNQLILKESYRLTRRLEIYYKCQRK